MNKAKYAKNTEGLLSGQVSIKSSMDFRTDLGNYFRHSAKRVRIKVAKSKNLLSFELLPLIS